MLDKDKENEAIFSLIETETKTVISLVRDYIKFMDMLIEWECEELLPFQQDDVDRHSASVKKLKDDLDELEKSACINFAQEDKSMEEIMKLYHRILKIKDSMDDATRSKLQHIIN